MLKKVLEGLSIFCFTGTVTLFLYPLLRWPNDPNPYYAPSAVLLALGILLVIIRHWNYFFGVSETTPQAAGNENGTATPSWITRSWNSAKNWTMEHPWFAGSVLCFVLGIGALLAGSWSVALVFMLLACAGFVTHTKKWVELGNFLRNETFTFVRVHWKGLWLTTSGVVFIGSLLMNTSSRFIFIFGLLFLLALITFLGKWRAVERVATRAAGKAPMICFGIPLFALGILSGPGNLSLVAGMMGMILIIAGLVYPVARAIHR